MILRRSPWGQIFEGVCTGYCHSPDVGQDRDVPDLLDCEWLHGDQDEDLFRVIMTGVAGTEMQGFNGRLPKQDGGASSLTSGRVRDAERASRVSGTGILDAGFQAVTA